MPGGGGGAWADHSGSLRQTARPGPGAGLQIGLGRRAQSRQHDTPPGPVGAGQRGGDGRSGLVGAGLVGPGLELGQQPDRGAAQGSGLVLQRPRQWDAQRLGQAARRRQAEPGRPHEGEQLEDVVGRKRGTAEAAHQGAGVTDHRRGVLGARGGGGEIEQLDLAVGRQPAGLALTGRQRGGVGQL